MTDLRTRIADVIARHRMDRSNYEMADAVIAELGMREQTGNNAAYPQVIPCADYLRTHHRYVTEWEADDE